jgi:hypothetical protein
MTFQEMLAADMATLTNADEFGSTVTYCEGNQETDLTAVVFEEVITTEDSNGVATKKRLRNVTFATTDVSSLSLRGTVRISDVEWAIESVAFRDDVQTTVVLVRPELHESTRPGYRRTT